MTRAGKAIPVRRPRRLDWIAKLRFYERGVPCECSEEVKSIVSFYGKEGVPSMSRLSDAQHEQIEKLAHQLWEERGRPLGSPGDDWFRAEQDFIRSWDSPSRLPFSSLTMEPVEY
jgi:hypothetical protein